MLNRGHNKQPQRCDHLGPAQTHRRSWGDSVAEALEGDIRSQLDTGRYHPSAVRRAEVPKEDGSERLLGIPTLMDRIIQQAIAQPLPDSASWRQRDGPASRLECQKATTSRKFPRTR